MLIFTAPSGAGKTTIVRHLLDKFPQLAFSVSATTRSKRDHEVHGHDYYFLTAENFRKKIEHKAFAEWEEVYDNCFYGTLNSEIERLWAAGLHIVFDIDVKGAVNLKESYPEEAFAIFVKPPSPEVLFARLRNRKTETEESLRKRIARATEELTYEDRFDYVLLNDELETAFSQAEHIVKKVLDIE